MTASEQGIKFTLKQYLAALDEAFDLNRVQLYQIDSSNQQETNTVFTGGNAAKLVVSMNINQPAQSPPIIQTQFTVFLTQQTGNWKSTLLPSYIFSMHKLLSKYGKTTKRQLQDLTREYTNRVKALEEELAQVKNELSETINKLRSKKQSKRNLLKGIVFLTKCSIVQAIIEHGKEQKKKSSDEIIECKSPTDEVPIAATGIKTKATEQPTSENKKKE